MYLGKKLCVVMEPDLRGYVDIYARVHISLLINQDNIL